MKQFLRICLLFCAAAGTLFCVSCGKSPDGKKQERRTANANPSPGSVATSAQQTQPVKKAAPAIPPAPKILPGLENGMLKIPSASSIKNRKEDIPEEKAKVEDSGKNIRMVEKKDAADMVILHGGGQKTDRKQKWEKVTPVPPQSLAAQLTPSAGGKAAEKGIAWAPVRVNSGISRSVRIPDAQLSPDQSLFVFAETTGKPEGPFGTRLILMNAHTWQIIRIVNVERQILKFTLIPGTEQVAAVCARQSMLEQPNGIAVFDLASGKECGFRMLKEPVTSFLVDPSKRIWITDAKNKHMAGYVSDDLQKEPVVTPLDSAGSVLALSPDGKKIAAAGSDGKLMIFDGNRMRPLSSVKFPAGISLAHLLFIDNEKRFLLAPDPLDNKPAFVLRNGQTYEISGRSSGLNLISGDGAKLFIGQKVKGRIDILNTDSLEVLQVMEPAAIRPLTGGASPEKFFLLDNLDAVAILDHAGNFYLMFQPEGAKKFQKEIIFTPQD